MANNLCAKCGKPIYALGYNDCRCPPYAGWHQGLCAVLTHGSRGVAAHCWNYGEAIKVADRKG